MFLLAKLIISNYIPERIEDDMLIQGEEELINISDANLSVEEFVEKFGYPLKVSVVSDDRKHILANEEQLGWMVYKGDKDWVKEEIDLNFINAIFDWWAGWVEIEIEDYDCDDIEALSSPVQLKLTEGLVTLKTPEDV